MSKEFIKSWLTGEVLFEAELDASFDGKEISIRLGAAVQLAVKAGTNLYGANLYGANLVRANLVRANLVRANLEDANLGNSLERFKQDFIAEVLKLPNELEALREFIVAGKIDGSTYSGECACLAGSFAKLKGIDKITSGGEISENGCAFRANSASPREQWFMMIKPGDVPEKSFAARMALGWLDEAISMRDHIRTAA